MEFRQICIRCMQEKPSAGMVCPFCGFDPAAYKAKSFVLEPLTILNGKYLLGEMLGAGGFGITYAALDLRLMRRVAIKEFYMQGSTYRDASHSTDVSYLDNSFNDSQAVRYSMEKFEKEAMLLARIESLPGIVHVHEIFNENNTCYIVLEYLEGATLKKYVSDNGGRVPAGDVLHKLFPMMDSLAVLHDRGILHRDISPDNIMVMKSGGVKLFDFGGAKNLGNSETQLSVLSFKKNGYSPVEQVLNQEQGPWTDVYALAATIYYSVTGKVPQDSIARLASDDLVPPSQAGAAIGKSVEIVLLKGMAIQKENRYRDVRKFKNALQDALNGKVPAGGQADRNRAETVPGDRGAGNRGTGNEGSGSNGSGSGRSGDRGSGSKGYENRGSGDRGSGGGDSRKKKPVWIFAVLGTAAIWVVIVAVMMGIRKRPGPVISDSTASEQTASSEQTAASEQTVSSEQKTSSEQTKLSEQTASSEQTKPSEQTASSDQTKPSEQTASSEQTKPSEQTASSEQTKPSPQAADGSLYPTPAGVTIKSASYNEAAPDWTEYTDLIAEIKSNIPAAERTAKMHQAEDILMNTAAVVPLYYYNDVYLQKPELTGVYSTPYIFKYFQDAAYSGDVLHINLSSEPFSLDPGLYSMPDDGTVIVNTFSGLYTYNAEGQLEPACADPANPYEVSEDGRTYTFHLRDGLKWSDGSPLTATDFEYAWKRCADDQTAADYSYLFTDMFAVNEDGEIDVTAADDMTLVAKLTAPAPYFIDLTAFPVFCPVPRSAVESADPDGISPVAWTADGGFLSNGAYTVDSWTHDESIVLKKNDNWYDADKVSIGEIDLMLSSDPSEVYAAYESGGIDFADQVPADKTDALLESGELHTLDNLGTYFAAFNVNSDLFKGKTAEQAANMRKAVSILIDRELITEISSLGMKPATSFIPAGMADGSGGIFKQNSDRYTYPVKDAVGYYPEKLQENAADEAIALLESAGYQFKDGRLSGETPINIHYLTNEGSSHMAIAEIIQQNLAVIGIDMTIEECDWKVFLDEREEGNFDLARGGWIADYNDPVNMLETWTPESGNNDSQLGKQ